MFLTLRIIFTVISAIFIAVAIPVGAIFGFDKAIFCVIAAFFCYCLMLLFKRKQENLVEQSQPKEPDFFNPDEKTNEVSDGKDR